MSESKRLLSLELTRGIAALTVASSHYFIARKMNAEFFENVAIVAVEVFFVLSGLVLAPQIAFCLESGKFTNFKVFFARRWIRTIPPFLIALFMVSFLADQLLTATFVKYCFFVKTFFSVHDANDYYPIAWSLAVEEWFYVFFPLCLLALGRWKLSILKRAVLFVLFCGVSKILTAVFLPTLLLQSRRIVLYRIDSIGLGFLLSYAFVRMNPVKNPQFGAWAAALGILAVGALTKILGAMTVASNVAATLAFCYAAFILGASVIWFMLSLEKSIAANSILSKLAIFLGRVSYTVYLFHVVFISSALQFLGSTNGVLTFFAFVLVLLGFTYGFYVYVERPLLASRPHYAVLPD